MLVRKWDALAAGAEGRVLPLNRRGAGVEAGGSQRFAFWNRPRPPPHPRALRGVV